MKLTETEAPPLADQPLTLTLTGADGVPREYDIPPCDGETLLVLLAVEKGAVTQDAMDRLAEWAATQSEHQQWARVLGAQACEAMIADGVPAPKIMHAVVTARYWHIAGDEAAAAYWRGELGKAVSPDSSSDTRTP